MRSPVPELHFEPEQLREKLLEWWRVNRRDFPWRKNRTPYRVLVAEVLLHRTKAQQVVPVFLEFMERFRDIEDVAAAGEQEILQILRPLGLRWRAKLLWQLACQIQEKYGGKIPSCREKLEELPGVSHYIASAVMCFAFGQPQVLLDTNTVRITGRLFGLRITDASRRSRKFRAILELLLDREHPAEFNYALIDLGALVCRADRPLCRECPLRGFCKGGG